MKTPNHRHAARPARGLRLSPALVFPLVFHLLGSCASAPPERPGATDDAVEDPILAEVDGEPIRLTDAERFFESRHEGHLALLAGKAELSKLVERVIDHRLLVREGYALGLDRDPAISNAVEAERIRLWRMRLEKDEVDSKIAVSDAEIESFNARSGDRFEAARILLATAEEGAEVRASLDGGADFALLARERSLAESASRDGVELPFSREVLDSEIEAALDRMSVGEIAGPIRARDGYWVVRLVSRTSGPAPSLDDARRVQVREVLSSRKREELSQALEERLLRDAGATTDDALLGQLAKDGLPAPDSAREIPVVARVGDETLTLEDVSEAVLLLSEIEPAPHKRLAFLRRRARDWAVSRSLDRLAMSGSPNPEDEAKLADLLEAYMDAKLRSDFVYDSAPPGEAEVREYYDRHPGEFTIPLQVQLFAIFHEKEQDAVETLARLDAEEPFGTVASARSEDPSTAPRGGEVGFVRPGDMLVELESTIESLRPGERSGIVRSSKGFHILMVRKRIEARTLSFDEARSAAAKSLGKVKRAEALARWVGTLRERSTVVVDRDGIDRALALIAERGDDAAPRVPTSHGNEAAEARQ